MDRKTVREIEWDCAQVLHRFYGFLDAKRYKDLADLFVEDGVWVRLGEELKGPAGILAAMGEREDWLTAHILTNVEVTVIDANTAETSQYVTLYRIEGYDAKSGPAEVVLPMGILRHRDQLVRVGETWKFKRKTSRAVMVNRGRITHYDREQVTR